MLKIAEHGHLDEHLELCAHRPRACPLCDKVCLRSRVPFAWRVVRVVCWYLTCVGACLQLVAPSAAEFERHLTTQGECARVFAPAHADARSAKVCPLFGRHRSLLLAADVAFCLNYWQLEVLLYRPFVYLRLPGRSAG